MAAAPKKIRATLSDPRAASGRTKLPVDVWAFLDRAARPKSKVASAPAVVTTARPPDSSDVLRCSSRVTCSAA